MCYSRELLTPFNPNSLQRAAAQWSGRSAAWRGRRGLRTSCNGASLPSLYTLRVARCNPRSCWRAAPFRLAFLWEGERLSRMVVKPFTVRWGSVAGTWAGHPRRLSRAASACSPSHVTGEGWWECAQGLPDPTSPAWLWQNPLGWWPRPPGTAGLPLCWSWACKGCSWSQASRCFFPSKDLPSSISFFSGLEAVPEPPSEEHPLKMSWTTCSPRVWHQHTHSATNSSSLPSVLTWMLKGERRPAHPCTT